MALPSLPALVVLFALGTGLVYVGANALTFKNSEPVITIPEDNVSTADFDVGKWLAEAPLKDLEDFVFGGLINSVEWLAKGIAGAAENVVNWVIRHLNPLFKVALPAIKIPAIFIKAVFLGLLGLFLINQIKGLADRAYSGITLFTAIILTAIAALVIIIVFSSVFIKVV